MIIGSYDMLFALTLGLRSIFLEMDCRHTRKASLGFWWNLIATTPEFSKVVNQNKLIVMHDKLEELHISTRKSQRTRVSSPKILISRSSHLLTGESPFSITTASIFSSSFFLKKKQVLMWGARCYLNLLWLLSRRG